MATVGLWKSKVNFQELAVSFHHMGLMMLWAMIPQEAWTTISSPKTGNQ